VRSSDALVVPVAPIRRARLRRRRQRPVRADEAPFLLLSVGLGTLIGYLAAIV
jgi:hypothetical protein